MSNAVENTVSVASDKSSEEVQVLELGLLSHSISPSFSEGGACTLAVAAPSSREDLLHLHLIGYSWCGISDGELPPLLLHPFLILEGFSTTHEEDLGLMCLTCVLQMHDQVGIQCCQSSPYCCKGCDEAGLPCIHMSLIPAHFILYLQLMLCVGSWLTSPPSCGLCAWAWMCLLQQGLLCQVLCFVLSFHWLPAPSLGSPGISFHVGGVLLAFVLPFWGCCGGPSGWGCGTSWCFVLCGRDPCFLGWGFSKSPQCFQIAYMSLIWGRSLLLIHLVFLLLSLVMTFRWRIFPSLSRSFLFPFL